jgi:hypothetical protein
MLSRHLVAMSKTRFTEAEIRRAIKGVLAGGTEITSVEIWDAYLS